MVERSAVDKESELIENKQSPSQCAHLSNYFSTSSGLSCGPGKDLARLYGSTINCPFSIIEKNVMQRKESCLIEDL